MFYLFLKITIGAAIRLFFRKITVVGAANIPQDKPLIVVSNHPSAFMDPLVLGMVMKNELHFFARADVFKSKIGNWFMKKAHVSPIYRIIDGVDSLEKNDAVFAHGYQLLAKKKTLLLFGEGFTDDEFIRRVKPLKKGSMRIALGAENKFNFSLGTQIVCAGINYSDPRKFRSDLLVSFSEPIDVSQYKKLFAEHPNKAMMELNKEIYLHLKKQVVHIENPENADLLEQLMSISKKSMNNNSDCRKIPLEKRWKFSKQLADKINLLPTEKIEELKKKTKEFFSSENWKAVVTEEPACVAGRLNGGKKLFYFLLGLPVFIFGIMANYIPVKVSSFLSRKISKRPVFWSGTDMVFSIITVPLYYILFLWVWYNFYFFHFLFAVLFLFLAPASGIFAYDYLKVVADTVKKKPSVKKSEKEHLEKLREDILKEIE